MNKSHVIQALINELQHSLSRMKAANAQAKENATDSESRAETKWDTSGLEASYLARGYAKQFEDTVKQLEILRNLELASLPADQVALGSLVQVQTGDYRDWLFVLPCCGGMEVNMEGTDVTIITPESPLANQLMQKTVGAAYRTPGGLEGTILQTL